MKRRGFIKNALAVPVMAVLTKALPVQAANPAIEQINTWKSYPYHHLVELKEDTLKREIKYLQETLKTSQAVAEQLVFGVKPGDVEFIHPFDMSELLNSMRDSECIFMNHTDKDQDIILFPNGKQYKMTTCMPARTKSLQ